MCMCGTEQGLFKTFTNFSDKSLQKQSKLENNILAGPEFLAGLV